MDRLEAGRVRTTRRVGVAILALATLTTGCATASGNCSSTTFGDVILFASCDETQSVAAKGALEAHAQRQVALGRRFGPFLGPWTALRAFADLFRGDGWSGPVHPVPEGGSGGGE